MEIISHRGFWRRIEEQNKLASYEHSFAQGFGVEIDVRDLCGKLIISHNVVKKNPLFFEEFADLYSNYIDLPVAVNVKSSGLCPLVKQAINKWKWNNYFVFDMAIPDTISYIKADIKIYTRQSEYEINPVFYKNSEGIWLDEFDHHWIDNKIIEYHLGQGKKICIVSPELHERSYFSEWEEYLDLDKRVQDESISICTDHPKEANEFFNGGKQ